MADQYSFSEASPATSGRRRGRAAPKRRRIATAVTCLVLTLTAVCALSVFAGASGPETPDQGGEQETLSEQHSAPRSIENSIPTALLSAEDQAVLLKARDRDWHAGDSEEHRALPAAVDDQAELVAFLAGPGVPIYLAFSRTPAAVTVRTWHPNQTGGDDGETINVTGTDRKYHFTLSAAERSGLVVEISAAFPELDGAGGAVTYAFFLVWDGAETPVEGEPSPETASGAESPGQLPLRRSGSSGQNTFREEEPSC